MHEHRYHGEISRLRSSERLAWLEVDRVVMLSTQASHPQRVLDVGTGSGIFAEAFHKLGLDAEGVDANPQMLAEAGRLVPGVVFQQGTAENLPYPNAAFDLVFMGLLFHETDDRPKAMREAARVTRHEVAVLEWRYEAQAIGPGLDERLTEKEIADLAAQAGLHVVQTVPLQALIFYLLRKD